MPDFSQGNRKKTPEEVRAQRIANLKPHRFQKGVSANPGGRPKSFATRINEATKNGQELIDTALQIARGTISAPAAVRMEALRWLTDRSQGKAPETTITVDATDSLLGVEISAEAVEQMLGALAVDPPPQIVDGLAVDLAVKTEEAPDNAPELLPVSDEVL